MMMVGSGNGGDYIIKVVIMMAEVGGGGIGIDVKQSYILLDGTLGDLMALVLVFL